MRTLTKVSGWVVAAVLAGAAAGASAQGGGKPPPPTLTDVQTTQATVSPEVLGRFGEAYLKDNEPRVLVLAGIDTRGVEAEGAQGEGLGANLRLFDDTGIPTRLTAAIEGWLRENKAADVDLVNLDALGVLKKREAEVLARNNEFAAVELIASELSADIVFFVRLRPARVVNAATDPDFFADAKTVDVRRGRTLSAKAFDYTGSNDIGRVRAYAGRISEFFLSDYAEYVEERPSGLRYVLRVSGLETDREVAEARGLIAGIDGVSGRPRAEFGSNDGGSFAEFTVRYDGGDAMDLSIEAQRVIEEGMGLSLTGYSTDASAIYLRAGAPKPPPPLPTWKGIEISDPEIVKDFAGAYNAKGRPSIGVIVNWLVRPDQMSAPVQGTQPMVMTSGQPRISNDVQGIGVLGAKQMEDLVSSFFTKYELDVRNPDQARRVLDSQLSKDRALGGEPDLATLLQGYDGFDILIEGYADVTLENATDPESMQYSFKITDLRNAKFLGSLRWPNRAFDLEKRSRTDPEPVGTFIGSQLLEQFYENYLKSASEMNVTVKSALSYRAVKALAEAIDDGVESVFQVSSPSFDNGLGRFDLRYTGDPKLITGTLEEVTATLPFSIDVQEADGGRLVLRMSAVDLPAGAAP